MSPVRGRQLRGLLNQVVGSEFPEFQQLQRDFRNVVVDPSMIRQDIEISYGVTSGNFPLIRKKRIDAAATASDASHGRRSLVPARAPETADQLVIPDIVGDASARFALRIRR